MIYQLQQMELSEAEKNDPFWGDEIKILPTGELMLVKDILSALDGKDFHYILVGNKGKQKTIGFEKEEWTYYFSVFHNCENFGLPNGNGWLNELPWTIHFLNQMKYVKEMIKVDAAKRANSASRKGDVVDSVNPNMFGG